MQLAFDLTVLGLSALGLNDSLYTKQRGVVTMKILKLAGLGAALALTTQMAVATPVTDWNWSLDSAFSEFTGAGVVASGDVYDNDGGTPGALIGQNTLTWGTNIGYGQSSLSISNPNLTTQNGSATPFNLAETAPGSGVYQDTVAGTLGIHNNHPIQGGSLTNFVMTEYFRLVPAAMGDPAGNSAIMSVFSADFKETPNQPALPCCDDIFVIEDASSLGNVASFVLSGYEYVLSLSTTGLDPLTDSQCAVLGYAPGCAGLVTQENAQNEFQFYVTLTAREVQVSEPSVLALMGLGLLGLAFRRRRNMSK